VDPKEETRHGLGSVQLITEPVIAGQTSATKDIAANTSNEAELNSPGRSLKLQCF